MQCATVFDRPNSTELFYSRSTELSQRAPPAAARSGERRGRASSHPPPGKPSRRGELGRALTHRPASPPGAARSGEPLLFRQTWSRCQKKWSKKNEVVYDLLTVLPLYWFDFLPNTFYGEKIGFSGAMLRLYWQKIPGDGQKRAPVYDFLRFLARFSPQKGSGRLFLTLFRVKSSQKSYTRALFWPSQLKSCQCMGFRDSDNWCDTHFGYFNRILQSHSARRRCPKGSTD